jgi:hypothetical protein
MTSTVRIANAMDLIAQKLESSFSCQEVGCGWMSTWSPDHKIHCANLKFSGAFSGVRMIHRVARKLMVRGGEKWTFSPRGRHPPVRHRAGR